MAHHEHTPVHHEHVDQWHLHSSAEGSPQSEHGSKVNALVLIGAFFFSVVFLVVFIMATITYARYYLSQRRAAKVELTTWADDARARKAEAESYLRNYGWVDPAHNRVRVPIESAMQEMSGHGLGIPAPDQPVPAQPGH